MKTNMNMVRRMGEFSVTQRTKDGLFNATMLLKQWNKITGMKKEVKDFMQNESTKEFIQVIENEPVPNGANCPYLATRGKQGGTWMHPYLFIDFAMWINPKFKYDVIKFVHDQLIEFRHNAGDNYKGLTSAVQKFNFVNYSQLAKGLNYIIFGRHERGMRQNAGVAELQKLSDLQSKLAFAIDMGYIKSFDELINEMRRMYKSLNLELP